MYFKSVLIESLKESGSDDRNGSSRKTEIVMIWNFHRAEYKMQLQAAEFAANDNITGNDDAICADKE